MDEIKHFGETSHFKIDAVIAVAKPGKELVLTK